MYSLTINPDKSAIYTVMVDNVQVTHEIPAADVAGILGVIEAAFEQYLASKV